MDTQTLKRLQDAGFVPTTITAFLELSPAEEAFVETKVRFTALLKQTRLERGWTQAQLAKELGTRQQMIARAERGGDSITIDFLLRALVTLNLSLTDLGAELRALDAALHPEMAASYDQASCATTRPISQSAGEFAPLDKESLIDPKQIAAASRPAAPVLELLRGGFQEVTPAAVAQANGVARLWSSTAQEGYSTPLAMTG